MGKVNLSEKFSLFGEFWEPKIVGELNDQYVKLAKLKGEFVWHQHENEDEFFMVISGQLTIKLRDENIMIDKMETSHGMESFSSLRSCEAFTHTRRSA